MAATTERREQMFEHIKAWKESSFSQRAFCEKFEIPYHVFTYWCKTFRTKKDIANARFIKLQVPQPVCSSSVELVCPDGKRLIFREPVSADYLKALIS